MTSPKDFSDQERECCHGGLCEGEWHRHPIHLFSFFLVVLLIQAMDLLLTLRIENLGDRSEPVEKLLRTIGNVTDVLFVAVLVIVVISLLRDRFVVSRESRSRFTLIVLSIYLFFASLNVLFNMITLVVAPSLRNTSQNWLIVDLGLLLSFNTQSTFGPTIEGIRTRPVKVMMMMQISLSLVVLVVLVARIIIAPT